MKTYMMSKGKAKGGKSGGSKRMGRNRFGNIERRGVKVASPV